MRHLRRPLWALMLIVISTVMVIAAPQQDGSKQAKPAESNQQVTFDKDGNLVVAPTKETLSGVIGLLLEIKLAEQRASINSDGNIVIKGQYPHDCLLFTQIMLAPSLSIQFEKCAEPAK